MIKSNFKLKAMDKVKDFDVIKGVGSIIPAAGGKDISVRQSGVHSNDHDSRLLAGRHATNELEHATNWFSSRTSATDVTSSGLEYQSIEDWEITVFYLNIFSYSYDLRIFISITIYSHTRFVKYISQDINII